MDVTVPQVRILSHPPVKGKPSSDKSRRYRRYALSKAEDNGWKCVYCRRTLTPDEVTGDHITPQSKGGPDAYRNIDPACAECNSKKGSLSVEEFRRQQRRRVRRERILHPNIEILNPRTNEWVRIGRRNKRRLTREFLNSGRFVFRTY